MYDYPPPPQNDKHEIEVSFIIPVFNTADYLPECLDSILKQSCLKEILIIDDGSSDGSLATALAYSRRHDCISVLHSRNEGQSAARNKGLKLARGRFVFFVDSDDYLADYDLAPVIAFAAEQNIPLVKFQARKIWPSENGSNECILPLPPANRDLEANEGEVSKGFTLLVKMEAVWIPAICWTLIDRSLLVREQLFFKEGLTAEDQLFYIQLLSCCGGLNVLEMNATVYNYRIRPNSTMTAPSEKFFADHFTVCRLLEEWKENAVGDTEAAAAVSRIMIRIYYSAWQMLNDFPDGQKQRMQARFTPELAALFKRS